MARSVAGLADRMSNVAVTITVWGSRISGLVYSVVCIFNDAGCKCRPDETVSKIGGVGTEY